MNLTLAEIAAHRSRLRQEIMERECLLAAFAVVEKYAASGYAPKSIALDSLASILLPSQPTLEFKEPTTPAPSAPTALPLASPPEDYIHPDLKHWRFSGHGAHASLVRWAIARMADDYSLRNIAALLEQEGKPLRSSEISVVLTRLKRDGEIEEIQPGYGPAPAVYRKSIMSSETPSAESQDDTESAQSSVQAI